MSNRDRIGPEERQGGDDASMRVLLAGESWIIHSTHIKGFDAFTTSEYAEGGTFLIKSLRQSDIQVRFMPNHSAPREFPLTLEELRHFHAVILSDIGSNTLTLHRRF